MTTGPRPGRSWTERAGDVEAEVAAELDAHFQGTVDLLVARGWTEEDARAEAERRFGDVDRYRHTLERMAKRRRRRRRARAALRDLGAACVSAARTVRRSPGLSAAVVVTLALGIGANAAIFRVVDRLLLSPPEHVARPYEVRRLHQDDLAGVGGAQRHGVVHLRGRPRPPRGRAPRPLRGGDAQDAGDSGRG